MAKVFLDYDQQALDAAYDQAMYAPNRDQLLARFARASELARQRLGAAERFAYGESAIEGLDVYRTKAANAPINVFVHGGAWREHVDRRIGRLGAIDVRSEEHTSELQSLTNLVCRLLLDKKKSFSSLAS